MEYNLIQREELIKITIESIGSNKPIYTLSIENDKTVKQLYDRILYDLEYEDKIILYINNNVLKLSNIKLSQIIKTSNIRLGISCKIYTEREILEDIINSLLY